MLLELDTNMIAIKPLSYPTHHQEINEPVLLGMYGKSGIPDYKKEVVKRQEK